jgi:hypothetical protein
MMGDLGWLGEVSTEITGAVDVDPDPSITGPGDMVVVKDLPAVVTTTSIQLEAYAFHQGRWDPDAEIEWTSHNWQATIDEDNVLHLEEPGTFALVAYLADDPSIETLVEYVVDFTYSIPELPNSRTLIYPNPAKDQINIAGVDKVKVEVLNSAGAIIIKKEKYSEGETIALGHLIPGIYLLKITDNSTSVVHKIIKQ